MLLVAVLALLAAWRDSDCARAQVRINEVVTDPQHDWNDSSGGNGIRFDDQPGTGTITDTDEWLELVNASSQSVSLRDWRLVMIDTTPATETLGAGAAVLRFERGGALDLFLPGEHVVIGNPSGAMNNDIWLRLIDAEGRLVDEVELGTRDFRANGLGDEAPNGNAHDASDEAVARQPEAVDTDADAADFRTGPATIGRANSSPLTRAIHWSMYR
jgi:hypothetical protein